MSEDGEGRDEGVTRVGMILKMGEMMGRSEEGGCGEGPT